jgi:hypothetical protein
MSVVQRFDDREFPAPSSYGRKVPSVSSFLPVKPFEYYETLHDWGKNHVHSFS